MVVLRQSCEILKGPVFRSDEQRKAVTTGVDASGRPHQDNLTSRTGTSGVYVLVLVKVQLANEFNH